MTQKLILMTIIIFSGFRSLGQRYSTNDFSYYNIHTIDHNLFHLADTLKKPFSVSIVGGELSLEDAKPKSGKVYHLATGRLVAINRGEWGGGLYYKPDDTTKETFFVDEKPVYDVATKLESDFTLGNNDPLRVLLKGKDFLISPGNIADATPFNKTWLYLQGWVNMTGKHGTLSKITMEKDSFTVSKLSEFQSYPIVLGVYMDEIFIVTDNCFYCIKNGKKELIFENPFWSSLFPNSIAIINEKNIYVGMLGGYAKINAKTKSINYFAYTH